MLDPGGDLRSAICRPCRIETRKSRTEQTRERKDWGLGGHIPLIMRELRVVDEKNYGRRREGMGWGLNSEARAFSCSICFPLKLSSKTR
ncbi:unnamed protein product [Linum trigynum]|uniref:Uncharacterized protein n=1 Tax=Linum trigynum TaxID=586398 RepID=A0AAV2EMV1_9ROSI